MERQRMSFERGNTAEANSARAEASPQAIRLAALLRQKEAGTSRPASCQLLRSCIAGVPAQQGLRAGRGGQHQLNVPAGRSSASWAWTSPE